MKWALEANVARPSSAIVVSTRLKGAFSPTTRNFPAPVSESDLKFVIVSYTLWAQLREDFKYYFADFVRKGGTPPFTDKIFAKKKVTDLGGSPPPFTDIPPKNVLQKVLKMVFFAQKTPVFGPKK